MPGKRYDGRIRSTAASGRETGPKNKPRMNVRGYLGDSPANNAPKDFTLTTVTGRTGMRQPEQSSDPTKSDRKAECKE
ncbi:hypothetical protein GCM10010973_17440 [Cribrihabitans marinus]|nr:hypothetical protein GCM10010973_17440 [Cribrihabitans marinus]